MPPSVACLQAAFDLFGDFDEETQRYKTTCEYLYIEGTELSLFELWLAIPHPEIALSNLLDQWTMVAELPPNNAATRDLLEELINDEQKWRFALVGQHIDIQATMFALEEIKETFEWEETRAMLEAEYEDFLKPYEGDYTEAYSRQDLAR